MNKEVISQGYQNVQDHICNAIERLDGKAQFVQDLWERAKGGGGKTRILKNGNLIEKGGVNFSEVFGELTPEMQKQLNINGDRFFACGVSIVLHPKSPLVPIIHMNIRYFETNDGEDYWFGGGVDLTPHYIRKEKAGEFHQSIKDICDQFDGDFYAKFKEQADNYFYIPHRSETRGIGGIFYDHLTEGNTSLGKEELFNFSEAIGLAFPDLYAAQCDLRHAAFSEAQKNWQLIRRGRYVEFNLVYDRGTKFGLFSNGRTESILMSLPFDARWVYDYSTIDDDEKNTLEMLKKGVDWINL